MRFFRSSRLALAALAFVAAGCSDSTGPGDTTLDLDGALEATDLAVLAPVAISMAPVGLGPIPNLAASASDCAYAASSQHFVCPPRTVQGITVTRSFTLLTAGGAPQSAFDPATTAAVRTHTTITGTLGSAAEGTVTLDGEETMTVSGLVARRPVLDGVQRMRITADFFGAGPTTSLVTTTTEGLQVPNRRGGQLYPLGGSITTVVSGPSHDDFDGSVTMRMEFNGTSIVLVSLTVGGVTQRCTVDLASTTRVGSACFAGER